MLHYRAHNRSSQDLFVARVPRDGAVRQYPDAAYLSLSEDALRLDAVLGPSALPLDREVEWHVTPLYAKLPAGQSAEGRVRFPLPAREWNAFSLPDSRVDKETVAVRQLALHLSGMPVGAPTQATLVDPSAGLWQAYRETFTAVCRVDLQAPIQVLKRSDDFPRLP